MRPSIPSGYHQYLPARRACAAAIALGIALAATPPVTAQSVTPTFTYQGELRSGGNPASASFDMEFRLFNADSNGTQIGSTVARPNVSAVNVLFAVPLDFGSTQFAGDRQWLEVRIRPAGGGAFETLTPRTEVTATPYALGAVAALANSVTGISIVDGSVQGADLAPAVVGVAQINTAQVQARISTNCAAGSAIRSVAANGTVTCEVALQGPAGPQGPIGAAGPAGPAGAAGPTGEISDSGDADGDEGTFLWADSQGSSIVSTGANQFMVRAQGGLWFGTTSFPIIPAGRFINTSSGAHLTTGGTWTNASSRALKTAFESIDAGDVLARLLALPLTRWQYRDSAAEGVHLGPVAEEFHAAFGLGADGSAISTVDANGVALAAIQGLNAKLEAENAALRDETAALRSRLEAIEARLGVGQ